MAADRIDFVDEDDARGIFLRLFEHVPDAACAHTDKHFDKVRTGDGEKGHACFARNRARQERLAGTGRTDQQRALGDLAAELGKATGVLQKFDNLFQLLAGFINPCDILEGNLALLFGQQLGLGLAKAHGSGAAALLHLAQHEEGNAEDQDERQGLDENDLPDAGLFLCLAAIFDALFIQQRHQRRIVADRRGGEQVSIGHFASYLVGRDGNAFHAALFDLVAERGIADSRTCIGRSARAKHGNGQQKRNNDAGPDEHALHPGVFFGILFVIHYASCPVISVAPDDGHPDALLPVP